MSAPMLKKRCAVYVRKSSEEGLDQAFNSLEAQREACEAYVASQRPEGWVLNRERYEDGGFSGGTLERPALQRMLADIEAGRIDIVVVYKIDRLSRSLMDFSRLVELFERKGVTFVSITQSFNTTSSMGRLTLNVLLSFAQFERELASERIRDKIAASKRRGMWMGGNVPLGYRVENRALLVDPKEVDAVHLIFRRFAVLGSVTALVEELAKAGHATRSGRHFDKQAIYRLLRNRLYVGEIVQGGEAFPGQHQGIIERALWDRVQAALSQNSRCRAAISRAKTPALLQGLIFASSGCAMTPTHTRRRGRLYRYYIATDALKTGKPADTVHRVPAAEVEQAVVSQMRAMVRQPEIVARTVQAAEQRGLSLQHHHVRRALGEFDRVWEELFPAEQARLVQLLVERIIVEPNGLRIRVRAEGLAGLLGELRAPPTDRKAA